MGRQHSIKRQRELVSRRVKMERNWREVTQWKRLNGIAYKSGRRCPPRPRLSSSSLSFSLSLSLSLFAFCAPPGSSLFLAGRERAPPRRPTFSIAGKESGGSIDRSKRSYIAYNVRTMYVPCHAESYIRPAEFLGNAGFGSIRLENEQHTMGQSIIGNGSN